MIDRAVLARCCTPEEAGLNVPISASDLFEHVGKRVGVAADCDALIETWARKSVHHHPVQALQSAVSAILTRALDGPLDGSAGEPLLRWRVHDGDKPWRLPRHAFKGWDNGEGRDLDMTWSTGKLFAFDTPDEFRLLADMNLPLLTTVGEVEAFKAAVAQICGAAEQSSLLRTPRHMSQWDEVMRQARDGEITPDEADAEAQRLGLGPLTNTPDPNLFDPSREAWWTYPMVIVWLVWRDLDGVREWMADYRAKWTYWHPWEGGGHVVQVMSPPMAATVLIRANRKPTQQASGNASDKMRRGAAELDEFLRQLRQALCAGKVQATGCPAGSSERKSIPAFEWADLETDGEHDALRRSVGSSRSIVWERILYSRDDVLREWKAARAAVGANSLEVLCREWLAGMMKASPTARTIKKADALSQARKDFKDSRDNSISDKAFGRAWDGAIEEANALAWKRGGAPKRNPDPRNHSPI